MAKVQGDLNFFIGFQLYFLKRFQLPDRGGYGAKHIPYVELRYGFTRPCSGVFHCYKDFYRIRCLFYLQIRILKGCIGQSVPEGP